jgi:NAD(P)-dependent dehydrogenase (short-subunit alcohol dehydrogenase family)
MVAGSADKPTRSPVPKSKEKKPVLPPQKQSPPGNESEMRPKPDHTLDSYKPGGKLEGKVAIVTGGDSGIGRAVSILYAKEGANVAIVYLSEDGDAEETRRLVEKEGKRCLLFRGDIGDEGFCRRVVEEVAGEFGTVNILVNNAAEQHPKERLEEITAEQLQRTFQTNVFGMFYLTKAALPHMKKGDTIINTTSVTAYRGSEALVDYASTKGAIVGFTRSLAKAVAEQQGVRVNAVAPGPVWTPLIPSTFPKEKVEKFGSDTIHGRPAEPGEIAPSYVFLASDDSIFFNGQVLHPNGGEIVGG